MSLKQAKPDLGSNRTLCLAKVAIRLKESVQRTLIKIILPYSAKRIS
jgi:hypothetical protein